MSLYASFDRFLDMLIPHDCFVCGQSRAASLVCRVCAASMPSLPEQSCPICALPSPDAAVCGQCQLSPPPFDATRALYTYAFPVDRMIKALKYRSRLAVAGYFAGLLADLPMPEGVDLVVPMPLHAKRLRERGFNQAVEIARPLARTAGLRLAPSIAMRVLDTVSQADLPLSERKANMRGAFACRAPLDGLSVLVVDDVMTTGTTLEALARTLKQHGAVSVYNLVIARTPPPARG